MGGGPPVFSPGFTSPNLLEASRHQLYRTITFYGASFQMLHALRRFVRVRSPLLTESLLLSFPLATKMFQFARFAFAPYAFRCE